MSRFLVGIPSLVYTARVLEKDLQRDFRSRMKVLLKNSPHVKLTGDLLSLFIRKVLTGTQSLLEDARIFDEFGYYDNQTRVIQKEFYSVV